MKNFLKSALKYIIVGVLLYIVGVLAVSWFSSGRVLFSAKYMTHGTSLFIPFIGVGALLIRDLLRLVDGKGKKKSKSSDKATDERGDEVNQFFNKDFVTMEELKENKDFNYNTLSTLRSSKKDGILIRAEVKKGNHMDINFVKPIHTLIVGTTSSGKTYRFVVPSLQLMSMTAAKPSFVITDPKGELYRTCSNQFRKEGYDVRVINLSDPFSSAQWNPLTHAYDLWKRSFELDREVKIHPAGDNPHNYNLILQRTFDYTSSSWFEFNGHAYIDKIVLDSDLKTHKTQLLDETFTALQDIATTLAPVENTKDPSWEKTAQKLIQAVMLAMLEDSNDSRLGMTRDKYNLYNVAKICNMTDSGRDTYATLKKYLFNYRDKFSKVHDLASTALNNAEGTSKNYMGFVSSKTAMFSDSGISFLTEKNEVDFVNIDEKPTAIFLIIPDEIRTRYPLAILFVTQLYKRLVEKARTLGGELKRHVYFMLDEFGNMPRFPEFGSIMTVGRSRGIYFELCVQSYSQLYQVYGQEEGKIIKDNCPIQFYIATEDMVTNKEFSELLGKKTIHTSTENKSVGPDGKESKSYSNQTVSRPIIYPEELMTLRDKGEIAIKTFTPNAAIRTKSTYAFENKNFNMEAPETVYMQRRALDEAKVFYDAKNRNSILEKAYDNDDDDDDDFDF